MEPDMAEHSVKPNGSLVIFGISNMISDLMDAAQLTGLSVKAIVMNQPEVLRDRTRSIHERIKRLQPEPAVLKLEAFTPGDDEVYITGTTSPERVHLVNQLKKDFEIEFLTLIHPTAYVSSWETLGEGVFVRANSVIGPETRLKSHAFINRGVTIGHDTVIGEYARLNPGCNVGGHVEIGRAAMIGMGANVIQELAIGNEAVVAAGAVVISDVPERTLVTGIPAKAKKTYGG
jgi:sugar O-acyltransferase (sialic acid O-acetyltransferase NeuD family)